MGRNSKLKSARRTESTYLARRHQRQRQNFVNSVSVGARINTSSFLDSIGGNDSLPSQAEADALLDHLSPGQFTQMIGVTYASILQHSTEQIDKRSRNAVSDLAKLTFVGFAMFTEYQGFCCLRTSAKHDFLSLRRSVVALTKLPQYQEGLRAFGIGNGATGRGLDIYRLMKGSMVGAAVNLKSAIEARDLSCEEASTVAAFWLLCGDHVENAASVAAGHVLCDAGELVLHYRQAERLEDAELCLSHRAADGLLHFYPVHESKALPISAIRKIRAFVSQYKGPRMAGEISDHPNAARLCRAIGLTIRDGHGFLSQSTKS